MAAFTSGFMIFNSRWWTFERTQYDRLRARAARVEQGEIVVSLKSVNHRGLDLHFHLPSRAGPDRARDPGASSRRAWRAATCR